MQISFVKMQGAGNDFVLIDEWSGPIIEGRDKKKFVKAIADRHFGAGADGVIFVQRSKSADAKFLFYNPDGSVAEMCGNGIRCFAKYVCEKGYLKKKTLSVETGAGLLKVEVASVEGDVYQVKVDMGKPAVEFIEWNLDLDGEIYPASSVSMGNPHAVMFFDDLEKVDVTGLGRRVRHYTGLFPSGTNVHFVEQKGVDEFEIRTYERGVEDETLACGTGICASAVAAFKSGRTTRKSLLFHARGGDIRIDLSEKDGEVDRVHMTGPAKTVYLGEFAY